MEAITEFVGTVNGIVWGIPMLILILGAGLFLTIGLRFLSIMKIPFGFSLLWKGRIPGDDAGDITPFNALMTSLSATIGTGNIAGVATAIFLGGPGAVFWMWMTALVGMATKYAEAVCAVRFRETDENGNFVGGPMYYIQNGMGANWRWLAITFALFAGIAGFGIGNMVQSNSIADALNTNFGIPHLYTGIIVALLVGAVLLGGIQRISEVAGRLVPLMAALYILASLVVLVINAGAIPHALGLIFTHAFTPTAATGGFRRLGGDHRRCSRWRSSFLHHDHRMVRQFRAFAAGPIAMLGTFIDTIISFRGNSSRPRRPDHRPVAGDLRLHHDHRMVLLFRAFAAVSVRHGHHHAVPRSLVAGGDCRGNDQTRLCLASGRYAERDDGDPEPDRADCAVAGRVRDHEGIFRHARQVGEQSVLGLRPGCRPKPVAKAVIVPPSPACYSLAVDDD